MAEHEFPEYLLGRVALYSNNLRKYSSTSYIPERMRKYLDQHPAIDLDQYYLIRYNKTGQLLEHSYHIRRYLKYVHLCLLHDADLNDRAPEELTWHQALRYKYLTGFIDHLEAKRRKKLLQNLGQTEGAEGAEAGEGEEPVLFTEALGNQGPIGNARFVPYESDNSSDDETGGQLQSKIPAQSALSHSARRNILISLNMMVAYYSSRLLEPLRVLKAEGIALDAEQKTYFKNWKAAKQYLEHTGKARRRDVRDFRKEAASRKRKEAHGRWVDWQVVANAWQLILKYWVDPVLAKYIF
jgi:hypothetical protein